MPVFFLCILLLPVESYSFRNIDSIIYPEIYRFHPGDDITWARSDIDDSGWDELPFGVFPYDRWDGIGWFRYVIEVDSSVGRTPIGFVLSQRGAVEVYLDGKRIYKAGQLGLIGEEEVPDLRWHLQAFSFTGTSDEKIRSRHLLAIRYSSRFLQKPWWSGYLPGFQFRFVNIEKTNADRQTYVRKITTHQFGLTGVCLVFALLHFLLHIFQARLKINLYFATLTVLAAVNIFFEFQRYLPDNPNDLIWSQRLAQVSFVLFALACLRFMYAVIYSKRPRIFIIFGLAAFGLCIWTGFQPFVVDQILFLYMLLAVAEITRALIATRKKESLFGGGWILRIGAAPLLLAIAFELLGGLRIIPRFWEFVDFPTPFYGMLGFIAGMSIFLAHHVSEMNKELERQLIHVKTLSAKTLEQERRAKTQAVERAKLEAENERKSRELEEARALQLSMLPQCIDRIPGLDICFHMDTATEVGGDYYDYDLGEDGTLTLTIGDATGHGMKAGTMVSVIKSLFVADASKSDIVPFFHKCNRTIRQMQLGNLYMSLILLKIKERNMVLSAAGMPPIFIYRHGTKSVEERIIKGMPLGGATQFPYKTVNIALNPGDTVLLMSDGYPELLNEQGEMLDYPRIKDIFREAAEKPSTEIVHHLMEAGEAWRNGRMQDDDITFVVFKIGDY